MPDKSPRRRAGAWLGRLSVSALLLALIFYLVPFSEVWTAARRISPVLWLGALALFLVGHAASAAKWRLLIGGGISYRQAFRAHLAGLAANLALPSVAGGDLVRAGVLMKHTQDKGRLAMGSLADRLIDTMGLALIALISVWLAWGPRVASDVWIGRVSLGLLVLAVAGFIAALAIARFASRLGPSGTRVRPLSKLVDSAAELARNPARLLLCLAISLAVQCLFVGINIAFAEAADVQAPVAAWFFAWTTAKLIAIAPVSLGGLGVREAGMAALLQPFGADPAKVVAVGLVWQSVLYASGLIGFLVQLQRRTPAEPAMERS